MTRVDPVGMGGRREPASRLPFEVVHPCWLIAVGDGERVEVLRSPLVRDDDEWLEPVHGYIKDHGLVLAAQQTFEDDDWMFGKVEMSVYVDPASGSLGWGLR